MFEWTDRRRARRIIALTKKKKNGVDITTEKIAGELAKAQGRILEIGPGGGNTLQYVPAGCEYVGLEPNPFLKEIILNEANKLGIKAEVVCESAEGMPFEDNSFDVVYSVRSLCAVQDLAKVLEEVRRVLKPGGVFLFAEHVAAPRRSFQYWLQKVWTLGHQCDLARDIETAIRSAGFREVRVEHFKSNAGKYAMLPRISGFARP
jgi:SAM-dependent methyltransferase